MSEKDEKRVLQQFTCKVYPEIKESLGDLMESGDFKTQNQLMETLIENYNFPKKANKENTEKVKALQTKNEELVSSYDKLLSDYEEMKSRIDTVLAVSQSNEMRVNELSEKLQLAESQIPGDDFLKVPVTPYQRMCMRVLADRERKKRKNNDINTDSIMMFVMDEVMINCNAFKFDALTGEEKRTAKKLVAELNQE